jgi:hypothetical protein
VPQSKLRKKSKLSKKKEVEAEERAGHVPVRASCHGWPGLLHDRLDGARSPLLIQMTRATSEAAGIAEIETDHGAFVKPGMARASGARFFPPAMAEPAEAGL